MPGPLAALRDFFASYPPGSRFTDESCLMLVESLQNCWEHLEGSDAEGMEAWKLERMEEPHWQPPVLTFTIERHGGTVMGSTRAELQHWTVNVDEGIASCGTLRGHRQVEPMAKRLRVEPVVEELVQLINEGREDQRLKWSRDGLRVTVSHRKAIEIAEVQQGAISPYRQTIEGRSKRLSKALAAKLEEAGWRLVSTHRGYTYETARR